MYHKRQYQIRCEKCKEIIDIDNTKLDFVLVDKFEKITQEFWIKIRDGKVDITNMDQSDFPKETIYTHAHTFICGCGNAITLDFISPDEEFDLEKVRDIGNGEGFTYIDSDDPLTDSIYYLEWMQDILNREGIKKDAAILLETLPSTKDLVLNLQTAMTEPEFKVLAAYADNYCDSEDQCAIEDFDHCCNYCKIFFFTSGISTAAYLDMELLEPKDLKDNE